MICNSYQLQDVCSFIDYRGKTPPKTTSGVPLITAKIIKNGTILRPQEYIALDYYDEWMRRGIPKKGSVVFTTEAPLGEVAQIKTGERLAFAQRVIILEPNPNVLSPNYLSYALQDMIIEKTDSNIRSLYVNMCVISQEIGKILPQIPFAMRMESLSFKQVYELSALSIDFSNGMNLNMFVPFCKRGKFARVYGELQDFQQTVYNIRNISTSLYGQTQEYDIQSLTMQNNIMRGVAVDPANNMALETLKNAINVRTAKFHEYTTGQLFELEKIAKVFYASKNRKQSWEDIKPSLAKQVEDIMRR